MLIIIFFGLVEMTFGLVRASYSLPEWQTVKLTFFAPWYGCLPFDRKIRSGSQKHNGKQYTSLPQNCYIRYSLNPKKGRICVARVWNREGTEKLVNGKQHSVWFVRTGMNRLPQNVLLNFRLEFPKSDLTIYLPSRISEIFCQMVSTQ